MLAKSIALVICVCITACSSAPGIAEVPQSPPADSSSDSGAFADADDATDDGDSGSSALEAATEAAAETSGDDAAATDAASTDVGSDTADAAAAVLSLPLFISGAPYFDKGTPAAGGFQMNSSADKIVCTRSLPATHAWSSWSATLTLSPTLVKCGAELRLMVDGVSVPALIPKDAPKPYTATINGSLVMPTVGAKTIEIWLTRSAPDASCGPVTAQPSTVTFTAP